MSQRFSRTVSACILFLLVAVVWSFPLALHMTDHLPGEVVGDNVSFLWNLWWMRQSGVSFFTTNALFAPLGTDLVLHTHTALQAAFAATALRPLPVVVAQNVVVVLTLAGNGFAAYLLAFHRTKDPLASIVAGLVFACSPYVSAHLLGHFNLISIWTLPLFTLCLLRTLETSSVMWSLVSGVCLLACAYTDYYYTVYCLVICAGLLVYRSNLVRIRLTPTPLSPRLRFILLGAISLVGVAIFSILLTGGIDGMYAGIRIRATEPGNLLTAEWALLFATLWLKFRPKGLLPAKDSLPTFARGLRVMVPGFAIFVCGALPLLVHGTRLWLNGDYSSPPHYWRSGAAGIDVASFALGNPFHPLTGRFTSAVYERLGLDRVEGVGWLGVSAWVCLLWAAARLRRHSELRPVVVLAGFFFLWSLGPWLTIGGWNTGLILPANFFGFVPVLSNARIPGRAIAVTLLAASLASAYVVAYASRRQRRAIVLAVGALLALDVFAAPFPLVKLDTPSIYAAIPPGTGAVLELPMGLRDGFGEVGAFDDHDLLFQMAHKRPIAGGFIARIAPSIVQRYASAPVFHSFLALSGPTAGPPVDGDRQLDASDVRKALKDASVQFVVLDLNLASPALIRYTRSAGMQQISEADHRVLFAVTD